MHGLRRVAYVLGGVNVFSLVLIALSLARVMCTPGEWAAPVLIVDGIAMQCAAAAALWSVALARSTPRWTSVAFGFPCAYATFVLVVFSVLHAAKVGVGA